MEPLSSLVLRPNISSLGVLDCSTAEPGGATPSAGHSIRKTDDLVNPNICRDYGINGVWHLGRSTDWSIC